MITQRVNEAMHLLSTGYPPHTVAEKMTIAPDSVAMYVYAYRRATGTTDRRDAIRHYLLTNGLGDPNGIRSTYATLPRALRLVADLIRQGVTDYAEMARRTGIKASTLHVYVCRLYERFQVSTRAELVDVLRKVTV